MHATCFAPIGQLACRLVVLLCIGLSVERGLTQEGPASQPGGAEVVPWPATTQALVADELNLRQPPSAEKFVATGNAVALLPLAATSPDPLARDVQDIMIRAMADLNAERLPDLESATAELRRAIESLDRFIQPGTPNGQAWRRFLRVPELEAEISKERPSLAALTELEMNMYQNYLGLEYPQFVQVRQALNHVVRATKYGIEPQRTLDVLNRRMEQLVRMLDESPEGAMTQTDALLGLVLTYLDESQQAPWAVQEVTRRFRTPNLQFYAREETVNRLLTRIVAKPSPVNECLLGTRIIGTACLSGHVWADVLPMLDGVSLNLNLTANMSSVNKGYNRGVVLRTTGTSPIWATKRIIATPAGISSTPATVATNLQTQVHSIEHKLRIVRRIARKKSAEQKPLADAIAQGRLQYRVRSQYDAEVNEQLAEASLKLGGLQQTRPEFKRLGIPQPKLAVYSTDTSIDGNVTHAAAFQLTASRSCPLPEPDSGVVVRAHQSVVVNAFDLFLTGRTIRSSDVDDLAKQFLGEVPEEIRNEAATENWSITLAAYRPLQIELDDNRIQIRLEMSHVSGENGTISGTSSASASYAVHIDQGQIHLQRQGEVITDFGSGGGGIRNTTLRSVLKKKFDSVFKESVVIQDADLVKTFPNISRFAVKDLAIDDGWLQIGIGERAGLAD